MSDIQKALSWRTRKKGTKRQIGQKFPIAGPRKRLARPKYPLGRGSIPYGTMKKTMLERLTMKAANDKWKHAAAGYEERGEKGWMIGIKYKDESTQTIPIIGVDTYEEALNKAKALMDQPVKNVHEITIVDPSLREILHKIGSGAKRALTAVWEEAKKMPARIERFVIAVARGIGRVDAIPDEMKEAYLEALRERPWASEGEIKRWLEERGLMGHPEVQQEITRRVAIIPEREKLPRIYIPPEEEYIERLPERPAEVREFIEMEPPKKPAERIPAHPFRTPSPFAPAEPEKPEVEKIRLPVKKRKILHVAEVEEDREE